MQEYWWKNAVIYGIDVERFCDGDGDGIGDFKGLMSKLPYLKELGVTCIWLLPFFPSTDRDNGYDITDYYRVDSRFGVFDDFLQFVRKCGEQGIRIVIDLVAHHTSTEHPWFQSARCDRTSPFRDFYVWADHPPSPAPGKGSMFPGQEDSVWTFDEVAQSYYYHRFYNFQPGLNHRNPAVLKEIEQVMDFWMSFGISGFRIDAASHMIENPLDPLGGIDKSHTVLRHIYSHVTERMADAMVLGEVDEDESKLKTFFDGEQLNMMFNFFLDNYLLLGLATEDARPIRGAIARLPPPPLNGQWANFLRNLDEADLERLTPEEMESVLAAFAPNEDMRIYGRGIRRRMAPMLEGDPARIKMAYSLLFAMPGSPCVCYGDEIGMGEDLSREGRGSVRAPMQWTGGRNGGFSKVPKGKLTQPMIEDGRFGYRKVNVEAQRKDDNSLLSLIMKLAKTRSSHHAIGNHDCHVLHGAPDEVLAIAYQAADEELVMLHNLSRRPARIEVDIDPVCRGDPQMLVGVETDAPDGNRLRAELSPYECRWMRWSR